MTDQSESNSEQVTSARPKTFFPWVVIVVVTAMLVVLNVFDDFLAEAVNLDPGVKNLASLGLPMVAMLLIGGWYLLRRARSFNLATFLALICFVAPIAFMVLFYPISAATRMLKDSSHVSGVARKQLWQNPQSRRHRGWKRPLNLTFLNSSVPTEMVV